MRAALEQPQPPLVAAIIAIVGSAVSVAIALGAFGSEEAQIIVAAAGVIASNVYLVVNELRHKALAQAGLLRPRQR